MGFPSGKAQGDVIDIAVWNHFGTRTIPARPFLDNAMRDNRAKYRRLMRASAERMLRGETAIGPALDILGSVAKADVQGEIRALRDPANAPSTIKAKGSSNPLVDTGRLTQAVTYEVRT